MTDLDAPSTAHRSGPGGPGPDRDQDRWRRWWRPLVWPVAGRPVPAPTGRHLLALIGEIVVPAAVLVAYPAVTGGLGWRTTLTFPPDLTLTVAVLSGSALAAGLVRLARLGLAGRRLTGTVGP